MTPQWKGRLVRSGVMLACWTFLGLLFVPQTYFANARGPVPLSWGQSIVASLLIFYVWAALTPAVLAFGRRFPIERAHLVRNLLLHVVASFVFAAAHLVLLRYVNDAYLALADLPYQPPVPLFLLILGIGATNVMLYWGLTAVSQALTFFARYQERDRLLAEAQLHSLKTQLQPHFLFNTMNAIAELMYEDTGRAERSLTQLSDLLRLALRSDQQQEVSLADEADFVRNYVAIQQTLLQERLNVSWMIDDGALHACVPNMLLQPLVENAIRHGVAPRAAGGSIAIRAARDRDRLRLEIEDDGVGIRSGTGPEGVGLRNTRARLRYLYGDRQSLEVTPQPAGPGTVARVTIPWRTIPGGGK